MKAFSANIYKRSLPRWPSYTCASGNRLAWDASETATNLYAYDGAGRLTHHVVNGQTRTFAYNFQGRMTSLTDIDGSEFAYEFDGEGNRLSQALNDCLSKRFVYDGADVLLELNPTNGVAYAWVNGPGIDQPIERLLFIDGEPRARRVFHADALGSVAALTDPEGLLTDTYAYTAFGTLRSRTGTDLNRVTYTAREQLGESSEWIYYRHRIYNALVARFTSLDTLRFSDGVNEWVYTVNRPLNLSDPWGLSGLLTIHSDSGQDSSLVSGHSWISYIKDGETERKTYGTWGNNPGQRGNGLHEDLEASYTGGVSRSAYITDEEEQLTDVINNYKNLGSDGWRALNPCSGFAREAWERATGEFLNDKKIGISTPTTLAESILAANGGSTWNMLSRSNPCDDCP